MSRKVVYVPSWWPSTQNPQAGNFFVDQAKVIARGHAVVVLLIDVIPFGIRVGTVLHDQTEGSLTLLRSVCPTLFPGGRIGHIRAMKKAFSSGVNAAGELLGGIDLIHAQHVDPAGMLGVAFGKRWGLPVIISEHASFVERYAHGSAYSDVRSAYKQATLVTAPSRFLANLLIQHGLRKDVEILFNPVDDDFRQILVQSRSHGSGEPWRLVSVGNLEKIKGYDFLIDAVAFLQRHGLPVELILVGEGQARLDLQLQVNRLGLNECVRLCGRCNRSEIIAIFSQSDIYVTSSLRETFGIAIVEALAAGLPVVCSRCGGPEDYISALNGRLVQPEDAFALAEGIREIIYNYSDFSRSNISATSIRYSAKAYLSRIDYLYSYTISLSRI